MTVNEMLDAVHNVDVLVLGDAVLDCWMTGEARALSREAPVPVVNVDDVTYSPGGAANAAANIAALGGQVAFIGLIGDDPNGKRLAEQLRKHDVSPHAIVTSPRWRTVVKRRLVSAGQVVARFDEVRQKQLPKADEQTLLDILEGLLAERPRDVLICDYNMGALTDRVRERIAAHRDRIRSLVVDAHHLSPWASTQPTVVTPDLSECQTLLGINENDDTGLHFVASHASALLGASGAAAVAVTLAGEGAVLLRSGCDPVHVPGTAALKRNATGAGDTFAAAFSLALAGGAPLEECLRLASSAARQVVEGEGTSVCRAGQLRASHTPVELDELLSRVRYYRETGQRIVFTNGCFDLLHRGHVAYLRQAKELGDVLVLGLNSDASVRRLKGPQRPVNRCEDRAAVLAELACVDVVCAFEEDNPSELIKLVKPDIYVKGGDYTPDMLPETPLVQELGGQVRIVDYVAHHSTTDLLTKIRRAESLS